LTLRSQAALFGLLAVAALAAVAVLWPTGPHAATRVAPIKLGESVRGRAINAIELGDPNADRKILVVGEIHGDERAGTAIAEQLARGPAPADVDLWIVPQLNPDGAARRTRQNARGVDLNRNFPWHWRRAGEPFDQEYSGPKPLSEPESRIAHRLIAKLRPDITIWFHQPLGLVDLSGGDASIERRFAKLTGLATRRLTRYRGSAASWQNDRIKGSTAFVTELRAGRFNSVAQERYAQAIRDLIEQTGP
jgi:protein MpaA